MFSLILKYFNSIFPQAMREKVEKSAMERNEGKDVLIENVTPYGEYELTEFDELRRVKSTGRYVRHKKDGIHYEPEPECFGTGKIVTYKEGVKIAEEYHEPDTDTLTDLAEEFIAELEEDIRELDKEIKRREGLS